MRSSIRVRVPGSVAGAACPGNVLEQRTGPESLVGTPNAAPPARNPFAFRSPGRARQRNAQRTPFETGSSPAAERKTPPRSLAVVRNRCRQGLAECAGMTSSRSAAIWSQTWRIKIASVAAMPISWRSE